MEKNHNISLEENIYDTVEVPHTFAQPVYTLFSQSGVEVWRKYIMDILDQ